MANPRHLFSNSKLFLFCGGGIFSSMIGQSRTIMDKKAFEILYHYYLNDFTKLAKTGLKEDTIYESFKSMISHDSKQTVRENFFHKLGDKLKGISLETDKVMPFHGIPEAMGLDCATNNYSRLNFSFPYTHENPFPVHGLIDSTEVDRGFTKVFDEIAAFFS